MIHLHNTLTGGKEKFEIAAGREVRIYVCGVTPYDSCHLGHARCYVVFDVLRRVLRALGHPVRFVQNFTDVDDKIIARAAERGVTTTRLVDDNIADFYNKMDALGIERADAYPRVTENIPDIVRLIEALMDRGAAYTAPDGVYFSVQAFPRYGKLSKKPLDDLQAGARVDVNVGKKDPLDFALWKRSKPGEPPEVSWDSPWGKGRPGWHIECSVMSLKYLGTGFDIHGGGLDLIFPHHENEIAQSEAATGLPFARFWMHNGFVTVNREKMSKSLGNFFALSDIFEKYHPSVVRYMLLAVHYRSPLDFSSELLEQARLSLSGLKDAIARATYVIRKLSATMDASDRADPQTRQTADLAMNDFLEALSDDLNTPAALSEMHRLMALVEKQFSGNTARPADIRHILGHVRKATDMLGIDLFPRTQDVLIPPDVTDLAHRREAARKAKDFKEADRLRAAISERGFVVEDTSSGARLLPKANG